MVDLGQIVEVRETASFEEANVLRKAGWIMLGLSQGSCAETGEAYFVYALGRTQRNTASNEFELTVQGSGLGSGSDFVQ